MTRANVIDGLRNGALLGIVTIFLCLTGFVFVIAGVLNEAFARGDQASILGVLLALTLIGLWGGSRVPRRSGADGWLGVAIGGIFSGLVSGALVAIFALIAGYNVDAGVNLRQYLIALSPDIVHALTLNLGTMSGALALFGLMLGANLIGSVFGLALSQRQIFKSAWDKWSQTRTALSELPALTSLRTHPAGRFVSYILLVLVIAFLPLVLNQAQNYTLGTIAIYVLLGLGLNIVVGLAGLLDLGYVAFYAVGAYTVALLTAPAPHHIMWNFWVVLPLGVLLAALAGVMLGVPVLRLRGDYLAIVTLGFGEIIRILAGSDALIDVVGGPMGITAIPQPQLFGISIGNVQFVYMLVISVALVIFVTSRLQHSRIGRAWVAIREDETVAAAMGISTLRYKLLAFGIGAAFAGLGGVLFAARNQFTNPQDHVLLVSINVLAVVIVGGMGSIPGVILGAFVLKGVPEILREFQDYRIILFGMLLVTMMILRPEGLWPSRRRKLEMHISAQEAAEELPLDPSIGGEVF